MKQNAKPNEFNLSLPAAMALSAIPTSGKSGFYQASKAFLLRITGL